jgi:hypothetical protein
MSIQFSKEAVIAKNKLAIDACDASIARLNKLGEAGLFSDDEADRLVQLSRATNEKTELRQVNAHLTAAATTVKPIDEAVANELNDLGNRLDEKIRNDLIANATIDFITSVLNDASKLRSITEGA